MDDIMAEGMEYFRENEEDESDNEGKHMLWNSKILNSKSWFFKIFRYQQWLKKE